MEKKRRVLIVGSGSAAYAAALRLAEGGERNLVILTDRRDNGTSRNAGSAKQTYYKLSMTGDEPDSVRAMAENLFEGGSTHGDHAYAMAAGSVRAFLKLFELGVPFPRNDMGEFVGYKTDHDPRSRGTSAGPLTSFFMTEALEKACLREKIRIADGKCAVSLAVEKGEIRGVVTVDKRGAVEAWPAANVILATGGPAAIYRNVVYPAGQTGMTGMALEAGARLENFAEWQYGIASVKFRWNLSGSYQQVIPRYFSLGEDGKERDFLRESGLFRDESDLLESIFLKGYQWPFTAGRLDGSSRVDLALYRELRAQRRVFLDYRTNPAGLTESLAGLPVTAEEYLRNSGALQATPVERLLAMNPGAVALYEAHGIDLRREALEITLAAQHNNGGIAVDAHWQTGIRGLYAVGEAAGTFGVHRPGGSALNAGQVGAARAAEAILSDREARRAGGKSLKDRVRETEETAERLLSGTGRGHLRIREEAEDRMSEAAAAMRAEEDLAPAREKISSLLAEWERDASAENAADLPAAFVTRDALVASLALLSAEELSAGTSGSRGSAVYLKEGKVVPEDELYRKSAAVTILEGKDIRSRWEPVRPLPEPDQWFERVWNADREKREKTNAPRVWRRKRL